MIVCDRISELPMQTAGIWPSYIDGLQHCKNSIQANLDKQSQMLQCSLQLTNCKRDTQDAVILTNIYFY
jgi:hypothetical protein